MVKINNVVGIGNEEREVKEVSRKKSILHNQPYVNNFPPFHAKNIVNIIINILKSSQRKSCLC